MKATLLAGLAAAALLSGAALAADAPSAAPSSSSPGVTSGSGGTGSSTGGAMNTPGSSATTGTTTSGEQTASAGNVTQGTLISALNNTDAEIKELKALSSLSASNVQVMSADDVTRGQSDPALKSAIDKNKSHSAQLQTEAQSNKAVSDALKKSGASASDVIAIDVAKDGNVTVFTKPKS